MKNDARICPLMECPWWTEEAGCVTSEDCPFEKTLSYALLRLHFTFRDLKSEIIKVFRNLSKRCS